MKLCVSFKVNFVKTAAKVLLFYYIRKHFTMLYGIKVRKVYAKTRICSTLHNSHRQKKYVFSTNKKAPLWTLEQEFEESADVILPVRPGVSAGTLVVRIFDMIGL